MFISQGHPGSLQAGKNMLSVFCDIYWMGTKLYLFSSLFFPFSFAFRKDLTMCVCMLACVNVPQYPVVTLQAPARFTSVTVSTTSPRFFCQQVSLLCLEGQILLPLCRLSLPVSVTLFLLTSLYICQPTTPSFVSRLHTSSLCYAA